MFENRAQISYCKLKDGHVEVYRGKDKDGKKIIDLFDQMTGVVQKIELKEGEYQGEKILNWNVHLKDGEDLAVLSLGYSSGFTRGFLNSLANADMNKPIRISCYVKSGENGDFNCPSLSQNGDWIKWKYEDVPKTTRVKVGSKEVINDEEAVEWTKKIVTEINDMLKNVPPDKAEEPPMEEEPPVPDDLPFA